MSASKLYKLRLSQVERAIEPFNTIKNAAVPPGGWLRAIRESLGRSLKTQAEIAGVSSGTLTKSERSEAEDRISLAQLRKLAAALDCELVYGLVPKKPLHEVIQDRAEFMAKQEILGVAHSMSLEDQRPSDAFIERQIDERRRELLDGSWARLWQ
ncbi:MULTISPECIES: helix-turn-helix domain-containing protein [Pseudomonas]|jgi:predicted DNA-binding mobile mystery protein A|uniref:Transcriptional regulator n=2 Tax=Pseudomonas TaxID=286 RepID=A0A127HTV8_PSEAZ|nr:MULTISPECIES: helix-turn-helix domain-containing protein [Pseudomonas]AMN78044.1 transcriptional regulator [Pseudomonas azotoformans]ETK24351.1 mobile mystery protein A [Pseudomonas sp. FH1]NWA37355.1 helix-turn-helix domain-containing protein [Pseudomonas reactans]NWC89356.1 helix-turn-helix domain-containing protein [Pseudomonas reactans]NWD33735.1 helix-turn-helix domain-containing protein [Pseudomonas reactans]